MLPINVFVSYADSFVGKRVLSQFQQFPSTYRVYGCTWDTDAAEKLNAAAAPRTHASQAGGLNIVTGGDAFAADAMDRSVDHDSCGTLTPCEVSRANTVPLVENVAAVAAVAGEAGGDTLSLSKNDPGSVPAPPLSSSPSTATFFSRHDVAATRAALLACDWIILELRQAQTVLNVVQFLQLQSSFVRPKRLVLLSSLMTWYATPALTAADADGGVGKDNADFNDEDGSGLDDDGMEEDAEAPYPPPPPQSLEKIVHSAQDAARHAVVDAMRVSHTTDSGDVTNASNTDHNGEDDGDEAVDGARVEVLTEDQYNRRVPHLHYMSWRDAEKAVAAAHHAKGLPLDTFVVCSGLPYGGEEDVLEPFFRLAWSAQPEKKNDDDNESRGEVRTAEAAVAIPATTAVLPIFGDGSQRVPLVHAQDLACFVRKLLSCPSANLPFPERRYLFATDGTNNNSWRSIVNGVNCMFGGRCVLQPVSPQSYPLYRDVDKFTLNLRVEAETMKALMDLQDDNEDEERERKSSNNSAAELATRLSNTWVAEGGLHLHLRAVAHEFAVARGVTPLRIAIVGPPLAGKTYLAARLARHYRLPCVSLDSVVAEYVAALQALRTCVAETKAAVLHAERVRRLGIKRRRVVARQQREWDAGAGDAVRMSDAEDAADDTSSHHNSEGGRENNNVMTAGGQHEVDTAAFALTPAEEEEVERFVQEWWADQPQVQAWKSKIGEMERVLLLRLHPRPPTPDANPKRRTTCGNSGSSKKKANAGKDAQKSKEEEEELQQLKASLQNAPFQSRALTLMLRWRLTQPDCRVQGFVLDGVPPTLELSRMIFGDDSEETVKPPATEEEALKPRYAGEGAATVSAAGGAESEEKGEDDAGVVGPAAAREPANNARLPDHVVVLQASDTFLLSRMRAMGVAAESSNSAAATAGAITSRATDVEAFQQDLQTYKREYEEATYSVLSYWECAAATTDVEGVPKTDRRAAVHLVTVEGHEPLVPPPPPTSVFAEVPVTDTERLLRESIIGPPHNFGKSLEEVQRDAVRQRCLQEEEENAHAEQAAAQAAAESAECAQELTTRSAEDDRLWELKKADLAELEARKQPMTRYLQERVLPLLHKGLLEVCATRPEDPVDFLAEWLIRHNPHDDTFCDI